MASDREGFVLAGVDVNDGVNYELESLQHVPAQKLPQFATNPNADGSALVDESHYGDSYFEGQIRVVPQSSADAGRALLGGIVDALQECERLEGGAPVEWTPNNATTTYIAHAITADYLEAPIEATGDNAGWMLHSPVVKFKLTCASFLEVEETELLAPTESAAAPQQVIYAQVGGDVPAEAQLIVTDKSSQDRRNLRVGRDLVEDESEPSTLLLAENLVTTGFSGEAKTRSGAYGSEKVKRAPAISQATTMCGTGPIAHVGSFRVFARVYAASEQARYRIAYRNGDGPLMPITYPGWVQPYVAGQFCSLDLGEVTFDKARNGEQVSEIRVEVKTADGSVAEVDLNYLELYPTTLGFFRARGLANNNPTKLLAYDTFVQSEAALTGKSLPMGGTWAGAGDSDDFAVYTVPVVGDHVVRRIAKSDSDLNTGRYAIAGSQEPATCKVTATFSATKVTQEKLRLGVFARYVDTNNWVMACLEASGAVVPSLHLKVIQRISGTVTTLDESETLALGTTLGTRTVSLAVAADGTWQAWTGEGSNVDGLALLSGQSSVFAVGGSLDEGKAGIYDAWSSSSENTRYASYFTLLAADTAGRICFSGQSCRLTSDGFSREDSTGAYEGDATLARGMNLYLNPGLNRLVLGMRRNDTDAEVDDHVTDKLSSELLVTQRFLAPR